MRGEAEVGIELGTLLAEVGADDDALRELTAAVDLFEGPRQSAR
jgi:hypothetical protein